MKVPENVRTKWILLSAALVAIGCSAVWGVPYFISQDGSTHLYNAFLMGRILTGDAAVQQYLELNSIAVPNSTGHWLLAAMLPIFGPFVTTKLITTLTFAGMVASAGWLRWKTAGDSGVSTSLLFGAVLAFNWLWFEGFYNFTIGVIGFAFTVGLYYGWRGQLNLSRAAVLALLMLLVYWSHIVSFAMLAGTVFLIAVLSESPDRRRTILFTAAALIPVIPLVVMFRSQSGSGGRFLPEWQSVENVLSIREWIVQFISADPFILLSRKTFPFISRSSPLFSLIAPLFLIAISCALLACGTILKDAKRFISRPLVLFSIAFLGSVIAAAFGPDHFGLRHGSILRERVLLCGLFLFIPLFIWDRKSIWSRCSVGLLIFVFLFQSAALWEYSLQTTVIAKEFLSAKEQIPDGKSIVSMVAARDNPRFHSQPESQLISFVGIDRGIRVWDNYEIGHYLFPVVARDPEQRAFVSGGTQPAVIDPNDPQSNSDLQLAKLENALAGCHHRIDIAVVWNRDPRITEILKGRFEDEAFYSNGRIELFRHK